MMLVLNIIVVYAGPVSTLDNHVLNGPLDRLLSSFACITHFTHLLAPLRWLHSLALFTGSLIHLAHSLM